MQEIFNLPSVPLCDKFKGENIYWNQSDRGEWNGFRGFGCRADLGLLSFDQKKVLKRLDEVNEEELFAVAEDLVN